MLRQPRLTFFLLLLDIIEKGKMARSQHAAGTLPPNIEQAFKAAKDKLDKEKDKKGWQNRVQVWVKGKKHLQTALVSRMGGEC